MISVVYRQNICSAFDSNLYPLHLHISFVEMKQIDSINDSGCFVYTHSLMGREDLNKSLPVYCMYYYISAYYTSQ